ncbi:conserved hypothetical protein [Roseibium sp. TrichSKD4]|uniref:HNH endonuclease n=1 Tax=Roseibium sp. TrichSKD4 TaxID=744980 RepID=UPI0001E56248|nr:HNH endonuclease [Roseibium sp. TrichSKD4]EFO33807.1 conserved hypothetical protein [Roseibium sp. TrichSKD4]
MRKIENPFGGRSIDEWIGDTPDSRVPDRVRDRVFTRHKGICHISGTKIRAGDAWELEHITPLALGGENRESNLAPALVEAHKEKTSSEKAQIAKADRIRRKHQGTWPASRAKIKSRGFARTRDV